MEQRYHVLNDAGDVVNVIMWDGTTEYDPGEGLRLDGPIGDETPAEALQADFREPDA